MGRTASGTFERPETHGAGVAALSLGALGVVYGDIGTSPLYAMRECFMHAMAPTPDNVLGVLSLIFWSLVLVIVTKYLIFVLRADHEGEGGTFSLLALALKEIRGRSTVFVLAGLFGASLLYGEGLLTPAISVLSAVEGLEGLEGPGGALHAWVVPLAIAILVGLFAMQRRGTNKVGAIFGPVMVVWFLTITIVAVPWILAEPRVFLAMNPWYGVQFFLNHGADGFWLLGSVVLCITGGEALYADMGHFGKRPIRIAWFGCAFPALLTNYFGQGALLLAHPELRQDCFYGLVSGVWRIPLILIATLAAIVASQALISGAFSLTRQAIQLGFLPRLEIKHTSSEAEGQIYVPEINAFLMVSCVLLVLVFRSSTALAAAYGMTVVGAMNVTTILFFFLARRWWGVARATMLTGLFLVVDLAFLIANLRKLPEGGWVPLAIGAVFFVVMTTWKAGRARLYESLRQASLPEDVFLADVAATSPVRVRGTAVFMTSSPNATPPVLLHHFKHNQVLHDQVVLLSIITDDVPFVARSKRVQVTRLEHGFFRVTAHYGFMQTPRILDVLRACDGHGLHVTQETTSFYLGREKLVITKKPGMMRWRKVLFGFLSRNAHAATDFFRLPVNRVVEMGTLVEF